MMLNSIQNSIRAKGYISQYVEQSPVPLYTTELAQEAISLVKKIIAEKKQNLILSYKEKRDITDLMLYENHLQSHQR